MMKRIELNISDGLYAAVYAFLYEIAREDELNDFIIEAIVDEFNACNNIFSGEVDEDGYTDGRTPTEHFID